MTDKKAAVEANRLAWDRAAEHHRADGQWRRLVDGFAQPGFSCLDEILTAQLRDLGLEGAAIAQLCCNNGRELISARNLGAAEAVGFDQAAAFLAQARELNGIAGLDCRFVEGNVLALPDAFDGRFDIVMVTIGVFGWMPDLLGFFRVAARLLKPGGAFLAYEEHPIQNMFEPERPEPLKAVNSYFRREPFIEAVSLDYYGNADYEAPTHYWFPYTLGEIVTTCIEAGLELVQLREYPHNINAAAYDIYEGQSVQFPLSYLLIARKAGRVP